MKRSELLDYLMNDLGLDEATAKTVRAALDNEKLDAKAGGLLQQRQYDELERRAAELELSHNGTDKQPGSRAYKEWYDKNFAAIQDLQTRAAKYEERYGKLDAAPPAAPPVAAFKPEDVERTVHEIIGKSYNPRWSSVVADSGKIIQRHLRAGRKTDIDFDHLGKIAAEKHNGNLVAAYEEWDKPEAETHAKAEQDRIVEQRVKEALAKARSEQSFPGGGGGSTSDTSPLARKVEKDKPTYNRAAVLQTAAEAIHGEPSGKPN